MTLLAWHRETSAGSPVVVLLHGWAQDGSAWGGWRETLRAAGVGMLACDLPGHRGSAEFEAPRGVDLARWSAQAITRDLATLGVDEADVVGFAEGGKVAAHLAVEGTARRMALVAPEFEEPPHHALEAAEALRDHRARLWSPEATELVARARASRHHEHATLADWLELATWPSAARLASMPAPVLVVVGADGAQRQDAPGLAALLGRSGLATVADDDVPLLDRPELKEIVMRFLTEADQ